MPQLQKEEVVVAALAPGGASTYSAVQIQKLLFLIDREIPKSIGGPLFRFRPYHYGPFDKAVYDVVDELELRGDMTVDRDANLRIRKFRLTQNGIERGNAVLEGISPKAKNYVQRISLFVRNSTFSQLVSAIYKAYPEMKQNSILAEQL